ncbi:MAG: chloride channel protein, partial [Pseudomonadota bacterium]
MLYKVKKKTLHYAKKLYSLLLGNPPSVDAGSTFSWYMMLIAVPLGLFVGKLVVGFLSLIQWASRFLFNLSDDQPPFDSGSAELIFVLMVPTLAGLIVGLIRWRLIAGSRIQGLGDVIYYVMKKNAKLPSKCGFWSSCASALSLAGGASAGAESPVAHLGAWVTSYVSRFKNITPTERRTLVACAVAAAIACAFNAPVGGAFFAMEIILGYFSPAIFAPIIIASVAGAVVTRHFKGDISTFILPEYQLVSLYELPGFILLGIVCALAAITLCRSIDLAQTAFHHLSTKIWIRPAIGGLLVGVVATQFPHILGIGTYITESILNHQLPLMILFILAITKILASAITIGSGFSSGTIGPALMIGAITGSFFGIIAGSVLPEFASSHGAYAIVGMGAMVSSIVGGPI